MNDMQRVFTLKLNVVFQPMDDDAIIVSLESEEIFKLNITGTQIVKLIEEEKSIQEIITILEEIFEVGGKELEQGVNQLFEDLLSAGLIQEKSNY